MERRPNLFGHFRAVVSRIRGRFALDGGAIALLITMLLAATLPTSAFTGNPSELALYEIELPAREARLDKMSASRTAPLPARARPLAMLPGLGVSAPSPDHLRATGRLALTTPPQAFAADFLAQVRESWAGPDGDFENWDDRTAGEMRHVLYRQTHAGYPVLGTRVQFTFGESALLHVDAKTQSDLDLDWAQPGISEPAARDESIADLPLARDVRWSAGELLVLPRSQSDLNEDRLVWELRVATFGPEAVWRMLVDAHSGELLERRLMVMATELTQVLGTVDADITFPSPYGSPITVPMADLRVDAFDGTVPVATGYTGGDGAFDLGDVEVTDLEIGFTLQGRYASIHDGNLAYPPPWAVLTNPTLPAAMTWDESVSTEAARGAFYHIHTAHDRLKEIDPDFLDLDVPVAALVNDSSETCNAYAYLNPAAPWMRFLVEGGGCSNTGEIADVVYHEYAHLATMYAYLPEDASFIYHEGFSDYFAATIMDTSLIGQGFRGEGTHLRNLVNDLTWPVLDPYCAQSSHCLGLLIAGTLWEIREGLIADLGDHDAGVDEADRLYHFMRAGRPHDYQDCIVQLLLVDDDDGDLTNGTPNLPLIAGAFESRNLGTLDVQFAHHPQPDTEAADAPILIEANLSSVWPIVDGSVQIAYRTSPDGRYVIDPMEEVGPFQYRYEIPGQPSGTQVEYYLLASDEGDHDNTYPAGAPEEDLTFYVGVDEVPPVIVHDDLQTVTEDATHLWLSAKVTDNTERVGTVHATVTLVTAEDTHTVERALTPKNAQFAPDVYEMAVPYEGVSEVTEVRYALSATDGSARLNEAVYPSSGEVSVEVLRGRTWDFDIQTDEITMDGDWAIGPPDLYTGAPLPISGGELVATNLNGNHGDELTSYLALPAFDLSEWDEGVLRFDSWYEIELDWDGAWIEVSTDGGIEWLHLTPPGGYPGRIYAGEEHGFRYCFTGMGPGWESIEIPLDHYVGLSDVRFRFLHFSDQYVNELGWYLDNISVQETQLLVSPSILNASQGEDEQVFLGWGPPDGINTERPTFSGYNVYRDTSPDFANPEKLNDTIREMRYWIDTDVENGQRYYYAVTAVYAYGEGPISPIAEGYPYVPELTVASTVEVTIEGEPEAEELIAIENAGTGYLNMSFYPADVGDTLDDVLPTHSFDGENDADWSLLIEDGVDGVAPDFASVSTREYNGLVQFRVALHDTLPDPYEDVAMVLFLDTDLDRSTGIPAYTVGADYILAMGANVFAQTQGELIAVLIDATYQIVGVPAHLIFQEGLDSLEVALQLQQIGSPSAVGINLAVSTLQEVEEALMRSALGSPENGKPTPRDFLAFLEQEWVTSDLVPDPPDADWLSLDSTFGVAEPGTPFDLTLAFDMTGLIEDQYEAQILLLTNDPQHPSASVHVRVDLAETHRPELSYWHTNSQSDGLLLEWAPDDPQAYDGFYLYRWSGDLDDEAGSIQLGGGLLTADDDSTYAYLDRTAGSGERLYYRLAAVTTGGDQVMIDPPAHRLYAPAAAARINLNAPWPNPFRSETLLRVNAPDANWDLVIVDVTGRLIRHLVKRGEGGAGVQIYPWDGRAEEGSPAPMGVYYAVARDGNRHTSRSIVLVR